MTNADFLKSDFPPPVVLDDFDPSSPGRFCNRELSWLAFNWRVLEEAKNPRVPLLERLRFLSIAASNLDEFYIVRVAGLRALVREGKMTPAQDGLTPAQQLTHINANASKLRNAQHRIFRTLRREMEAQNIILLDRTTIDDNDKPYLRTLFHNTIFAALSPLAIDPAHPFPFIANLGSALALHLEHIKNKTRLRALLPLPGKVARLIPLPSANGAERFLPLEELLLLHLDSLFPGYRSRGHCTFSLLRDSDLEVEEDAEDLVREFEVALKRRRRGSVVLLKLSAKAPAALKALIVEALGLSEQEVIDVDGLIGIGDLRGLILPHRTDLLWPPFTPRVPERLQDHKGDIFAAIRQKDMLLHHPYESFDMVVRFLEQAAQDPQVVAIKQTLYRTSRDSPIVQALCEAAEEGKSVTAFVELKARFDEAANIRQSRRLERAGVHVVYGFIDLKTHAKISAVVRREGARLAVYTHHGTGNYHPVTARVYTDLSFFTCDAVLGRDATRIFNHLSGYAETEKLESIAISPICLRPYLLAMIAKEAEHARAGKPAAIWAKLNALIDRAVIDALYAAAQAGVKISLVVRGICGIRPAIRGLSENIRVKSIVGRFLEHSRIVCFGNGHGLPSRGARVYISSADWMSRNMKRRVETLVEITNPTVKAQIVDQIMAANLADVAQSWVMAADGSFARPQLPKGRFAFNCHRFFMENPSLSGRGSAGADDVPQLTHTAE
ncbi:MAG: RNA degradosome polyphosphate kinase [Rhodobacteraceae bacterium]|nr:RNA degradosome polyphosphate kinase [Paracoccaceae bacterium]